MTPARSFARFFPATYALSGAAGLVHEIAWARLLGLHMGHTTAATGTVLAAFMGGLAVGSGLASPVVERLEPRRAMRAYALLEVGVAGLALITPGALESLSPWLSSAYRQDEGGLSFAVTRALLSFLLLTLPAAAIGATFPAALRAWSRPADAPGAAGTLYTVNVIGASIGSLVTGFVLLPRLGLTQTIWFGALLNVAAAALAWWWSSSLSSSPPAQGESEPQTPARFVLPAPVWAPALAVSTSGLVSLLWEVGWTRVTALLVGPTIYALSTMLTTFIAGFAVGAALGAGIARRTSRPLVAAAAALLLAAAASLAARGAVDLVVLTVAGVVRDPAASFARALATQALLTSLLTFPMAVLLGMVFPLALAAVRPRPNYTGAVARLYALNTVGGIVGSIAASAFLVPLLGVQTTIIVGAALCALTAALLAVATAPRAFALGIAVSALLVVGAGLRSTGWNRALLTSGAYHYASAIPIPDLEAALTLGSLVYYKEGGAGTVAVKDAGGTRSLVIDGKVDASNGGDMLTQSLLAHVPLLLHPRPRRVAVVGLGSGVTVRSALTHPLERVDVVEISPEVIEAASYFAADNHHALSDPRTRLIAGDGRSHLQLTGTTYDVIVSEPSNPWMTGVAALFTREFLLAARARLSSGGVMCQWAHTYDLGPDDLRSIVRTFLTVFPSATLWLVGEGDILLVGSEAPQDAALARIGETWTRPGVAADLATVRVTGIASLMSLYVAGGAALEAYAGAASVQTDDRSSLEFSAPLAMYARAVNRNVESLSALRSAAPRPAAVQHHAVQTAAERRDRGLMLRAAGAMRPAFDDLRAAVLADPHDRTALQALLDVGIATGAARELEATLAFLVKANPATLGPRVAWSRLAASRGDVATASRLIAEALAIDDGDADVQEQLASLLADIGDPDRLAPVVARMRAARSLAPGTLYYDASLRFLRGDFHGAIFTGRAAAASPAWSARAHTLIGAAHASLGDASAARDSFTKSLSIDPRDPATHTNLATLQMQAGDLAAAARSYAQVLAIEPDSTPATLALADVLDRQGHRRRAEALRRQARH